MGHYRGQKRIFRDSREYLTFNVCERLHGLVLYLLGVWVSTTISTTSEED